MGISGLLPLLKSIQRPTEIKKFAGETLAVDAYGWLHRGAVSCALDLALGKPTRKYVDFAMHRVRMVRHFGATPYLVFDGDFLPSKALTEGSRAKRREESKKAGMELLKAGKPAQAYLEFQKAIDVTPEMARHLIEELKKIGLPYVVAPYEADAQMVYLERHGYVTGIISEDSDLLVFGAKRLLTKLDQYGQCVEINRRDFCACREISLTGWTDTEFRQMAIFSGCDYLDGLDKIGLKTAYRMIRKHKTPEKVIRMLQFEGKHRISENYLALFKQAELTFLHQRVFCPEKKELVLLTEPTSGLDVEGMPFIGAKVDPELARAIAVGDVNPISKEPIILQNLPEKRRTRSHRSESASAASAHVPSRSLGKSIDEYFKGHRRIPMGEMDANCFAVDPQRVAALTRNGLAPRVFPLPRPYLDETVAASSSAPRPYIAPHLHRRRTEPIANLIGLDSSSSTSSRRRTAGPVVRNSDEADLAGVGSSARPPKKARLCDDERTPSLEREQGAASPERSKFFPAGHIRRAKPKRSEAFLMSDDSIEDALLSLPDFEFDHACLGSPKSKRSRKSMQVFEDRPEKPAESPEVVTETPTKLRDSPKEGREAADVSASSPLGVATSETPSFRGNQPETNRLRSTLGKFTYTPNAPAFSSNGTQMAFGLPTPDSSFVGIDAGMKNPAPSSSSDTPRLTPLQRIGANALHRDKKPATSTFLSPKGSSSDLKRAATSGGRRTTAGRRSLPAPAPVNPVFVPLPKVDPDEVEALNKPFGSEDQIIPDSDGENDPFSPDIAGARRLDLARYLYR